MVLYIDALFKRGRNCPSMCASAFGVKDMTSDTEGARDIPPHLLVPSAILVATGDGDARLFDCEETDKLLADFGEYMETAPLTGFETCIGWYMDQFVIPAICASSMATGTRSVTRWMRRLDDKWSKTQALSLERAFFQGWYPESRKEFADGRTGLTLKDALATCGLPPLGELGDDDMPGAASILLPRIAGINLLYNRYLKVSTRP